MPSLRSAAVTGASVPEWATFLEAARTLAHHRLAAIAVLDEADRVVGLFTQDDMLAGLFPGYLTELRHTAFLQEGLDALAARAEIAGGHPVAKHMRSPLSVDVEASAAHVAERFLHCEWGAIAVVENERFVGMLDQGEFCRTILSRLDS
ncbi:MAG: CBS domain-containing protein [Thermoleophilia bacterium]|nr:CBS domain-containing protein [Thermoleophilia bacterium]